MSYRFSYSIIFGVLLLFADRSYSQVTTTTKKGYVFEFNEDELYHYFKIHTSDSTIDAKKIRNEIWKDSQNVKTAKYYYEYEGETIRIEKIEVFDASNKLIFSVIKNYGTPIQMYSFTYDKSGRLIKRSGYSSGDSGSTTYYSYKNDPNSP